MNIYICLLTVFTTLFLSFSFFKLKYNQLELHALFLWKLS